VASRSAFRAETDAPAYAVSKAGMVNLTRCLARAMAHEGILSYCIAPGWVETAMAREGMETMREEIESQIPLGRIASVEDVAGVALFLASDAANYLTGITVDVNGGSYLH
jgi:3-oxoacyl-[acyl-carrier protein] reductase